MDYKEISKCYDVLALPFGVGQDEIKKAADYLSYVWRHESTTHNPRYQDQAPAELARVLDAREKLLALKPQEILEAYASRSEQKAVRSQNQPQRPKIFISYVRDDREDAERLYRDLESRGFAPWLDTQKLRPGERFRLTIDREIGRSRYFVALLSLRSINHRGLVQLELRLALDVLKTVPADEIFVIPARLEPCEPKEPELRELHWVDLFPDWKRGVECIVTSVRDHC